MPPRSRATSRPGARSCATPISRSTKPSRTPDAMQDIPTVLGDVIERNARYFPGKTAVVCEERRVTYSEFAARVRKFANALASGGLQPQARFAILAQNCLEYFEAVGAAERAGFIAVTLNWRLSPQELGQILDDRRPTGVGFRGPLTPR